MRHATLALASATVAALLLLSLREPHAPRQCWSSPDAAAVRDPCSAKMTRRAPERFRAVWDTNYGAFETTCVRARAPVWVDRVFSLLASGHYDENYFLRVVKSRGLSVVQFGTAGDPSVSRAYNWTTPVPCGILAPQPDAMPFCSAARPCDGVAGLSNTFGTLSMSTSFHEGARTTWNATAELFINTGDNAWLDAMRFVPICTVDSGMEAVLRFPSFGELAELGGSGPSLGRLYAEGNEYIARTSAWRGMARTNVVQVCTS